MTHPILRTMADEEAAEQIRSSRESLERITGQPVQGFAYPNGRPGHDYTERDRDLVSSLGFSYALSTRPAAATMACDPFQLPRVTPWDREPAKWLARLLLGFRTVNGK